MRILIWTLVSSAILLAGRLANADPIVLNSSFEDNVTTGPPGAPYGPINDWAQSPNPSGLGGYQYLSGAAAFGQFPWDNGTVPGEGTSGQVGFIQVFPGVATLSLEQTVSGFVPGTIYQLSYDENARGGSDPLVQVLVGGNVVVAQHVDNSVGGSNSFRVVDSILFTAGSTSEQVVLNVSQSSSDQDGTATFDNVTITAIPEPATLVQLLGLGAVGLIAVGLRRRKA